MKTHITLWGILKPTTTDIFEDRIAIPFRKYLKRNAHNFKELLIYFFNITKVHIHLRSIFAQIKFI